MTLPRNAASLPPPQPAPFFRLPARIRQRIYRNLGLASWHGTPFIYHLHAGQLKNSRRFIPDPHSFHGLLLSCRTIHTEAAALLYSANHFILYYSDPPIAPGPIQISRRPLHLLHTLTAPSLLALTNLTIVLNEATCHVPTHTGHRRDCCLSRGRGSATTRLPLCQEECRHQHQHQRPLLSGDEHSNDDGLAAASAVVEEWRSASRRLSEAAPGRLVLNLVCDIDPQHPRAMDLAKEILLPIHLLPPGHLKQCNVRLAKTVDRRLQQLAEDTTAYARGILIPAPSRNPTTTLVSLPRELRLRILEYTDLVTPRRQVLWSRLDHAYSIYRHRSDKHGNPDERHSDRFSECWRDVSDRGGRDTNGCFCRCRHAASSVVCTCWAAPGPSLFLICRALYEDAQFVFFSGNRFVVYDYEPSPPWELHIPEQYQEDNRPTHPMPLHPYHAKRFAISEFLREVVPLRSLPHIRFLELLFPPYRPPLNWPETDHPAFQDWRATVDWLKDKVNLPGLTLRLVVVPPRTGYPRSVYRTITPGEADTVMTAYSDLVQPLRQLAARGLARFYAHFPSPVEWTLEGIAARGGPPWHRWRRSKREPLKQHAESDVMGSRYGALYDDGTEEPSASDWQTISYHS